MLNYVVPLLASKGYKFVTLAECLGRQPYAKTVAAGVRDVRVMFRIHCPSLIVFCVGHLDLRQEAPPWYGYEQEIVGLTALLALPPWNRPWHSFSRALATIAHYYAHGLSDTLGHFLHYTTTVNRI